MGGVLGSPRAEDTPPCPPPCPPAPARHPPQRPVPRGWCSRGRCLLEQRVALMRVLAALCPLFPPPPKLSYMSPGITGGLSPSGGPPSQCQVSLVPCPPPSCPRCCPSPAVPGPMGCTRRPDPADEGLPGPSGVPHPPAVVGGPSPGCPVAVASLPSSNAPPPRACWLGNAVYISLYFSSFVTYQWFNKKIKFTGEKKRNKKFHPPGLETPPVLGVTPKGEGGGPVARGAGPLVSSSLKVSPKPPPCREPDPPTPREGP